MRVKSFSTEHNFTITSNIFINFTQILFLLAKIIFFWQINQKLSLVLPPPLLSLYSSSSFAHFSIKHLIRQCSFDLVYSRIASENGCQCFDRVQDLVFIYTSERKCTKRHKDLQSLFASRAFLARINQILQQILYVCKLYKSNAA